MGINASNITPAMLKRMGEAEARLYFQYVAFPGIETMDRKIERGIAKLEREEQGKFADWLNQNGWKGGFVWHSTHKASTATRGTPDFVVPTKNGTVWLEFKAPQGTLSIEQKAFALVLAQQNQKLHVVGTAAQAINLVKNQKH